MTLSIGQIRGQGHSSKLKVTAGMHTVPFSAESDSVKPGKPLRQCEGKADLN